MLKPKLDTEIATLMHYQLAKTANNHDFSNLDQAVDYLNSAIDVLENSGFTAHADALLNILYKTALKNTNVKSSMPELTFLNYLRFINFTFPINNKEKSVDDLINIAFNSEDKKNKEIARAALSKKAIIESEEIKKILDLSSDEQLTEEEYKKVLPQIFLEERIADGILIGSPVHTLINRDKELQKVREEKEAEVIEERSKYENALLKFYQYLQSENIKYKNQDVFDILAKILSKDTSIQNKLHYKAIFNTLVREKKDKIAELLNIDKSELNEHVYKKFLNKNIYMPIQDIQYYLMFEPRVEGFPYRGDVVGRMPYSESRTYYPVVTASKKNKPKNPTKTPDPYTKNLNSDKMIKNLKGHGTVFNMPDSNQVDDLLDDDVTFEEED